MARQELVRGSAAGATSGVPDLWSVLGDADDNFVELYAQWESFATDVSVASAASVAAAASAAAGATSEANAATSAAAIGTVVAGSAWVDVTKSPYSATGDGTTNDTTAIQNALNALGLIGGGTLYFPPGTYKTSTTLQVPSNVWIKGAGWSTIIRTAGVTITTRTIAGVAFSAAFACASAKNIHFSDLYIDLRTNSTVCNGIQVNDHGCSGTVSDVLVERVKILGNDAHMYLVYGVKSDRMTTRDCYLEGAASAPATQDVNCIEYTGGTLVSALNNDCRNGATGVIFRSDLASTSPVNNGFAIGNRVDSCVVGICTSPTTAGGMYDIAILGNTILNSQSSSARAIKVELNASTTTRNLTIAGNTARETGRTLIDFAGASGATATGIVCSDNALYASSNCDSYASFTYAQNVKFVDNDMSGGGAYYGISLASSTDCEVDGNRVVGTRRTGVQIENGCARISIRRNNLKDIASSASTYPSLRVDTSTPSSDIWFDHNTLRQATANAGLVIDLTGCTSGGTAYDNLIPDARSTQQLCDFHSTTKARRQVGASPSGSSDYGERGDYFRDGSYDYYCSATNTWGRSAFSGGF